MQKIASALVKAQKAFGPLLKTSVNPAFNRGGKGGKYADLASCVDTVMESLNNNGIALIQQLSECVDGVIVETVFVHESGEMLNCGKLHVPAAKQDPQGYGSALTYARRYSLMSACGIAPEDDDGNAASKPTEQAPVITKEQVAEIEALIDEVKADKAGLLNWVSQNTNSEVKTIGQIPNVAYVHVIKILEKKRSAA